MKRKYLPLTLPVLLFFCYNVAAAQSTPQAEAKSQSHQEPPSSITLEKAIKDFGFPDKKLFQHSADGDAAYKAAKTAWVLKNPEVYKKIQETPIQTTPITTTRPTPAN